MLITEIKCNFTGPYWVLTTMKAITLTLALALLLVGCGSCKSVQGGATSTVPQQQGKIFKILVWNIQNGMWSDQGNNYDNFVTWVKANDPDVCIWCESRSNYQTGKKTAMPDAGVYLPDGWGELAARYGHSYWGKGGHRDRFPQVITSKYPVEVVQQIIGNEADSVVSHGAGHFKVMLADQPVNFVSLHTWPQKYAFGVSGTAAQEASKAENGGDKYRLKEITYICEHTIAKSKDPETEWWLMAGDFNAQSSLDNEQYKYSLDDTRFLVHDYVLENTPYKDVIKQQHPAEFKSTTSGSSRIDFVYCSPAMMKQVTYADVVRDGWTGTIVKDEETGFKHPSDHRPLIVYVKVPTRK